MSNSFYRFTGEFSYPHEKTVVNRLSLLLLVTSLLFSSFLFAQKKPLDHDVYDEWETFGAWQISPNGTWSLYSVNPQEGDKTLYIQDNQSQNPRQKIHRGVSGKIADNSNYAVFLIKPFYKDIKADRVRKQQKNKKANGKEEKLAKDSLGIYNYAKNDLHKIPEVTGFKLPEKNGDYLAYIKDVSKEKEKESEEETKDTINSNAKDSINGEDEGKRLVLRRLGDGRESSYPEVDEYVFSEDGSKLIYTIKEYPKKEKDKEEEEKDAEEKDEAKEEKPAAGVYLVDTKTEEVTVLLEKPGAYTKLQFNEDQDKLAFLGTHDEKDEEVKDFKLYLYDFGSSQLDSITSSIAGMPEDQVISENYSPSFSKDGKKLFLGIAPEKEPKDTTFIAEDHAVLDVWHYKDDYLQTQQLARLKRDLKKSYLSVIHLDNLDKIIPLQDEKMNFVQKVNEGNADFVLGMSDYGNRIEQQWDVSGIRTYYIIDIKTGDKTEAIKDLKGMATVSPNGKHLVFYDSTSENWYAYAIASGEIRHLNKDIEAAFADERNDLPAEASPYGIAGWTDKDESVLIYDRYDIWEFFLDADKKARNVTDSYGRKNDINFRYLRLDPEERMIPRNRNLMLSAFQEDDKQSGIYQTTIKSNRKPQKRLMEPMSGHRSLRKAKDREVYGFIHSSFEIPPAMVTTTNFRKFNQLHKTNKQQEDYNWGTVELISYTAQNGKPATGMLYKPEDFDENEKYPLLVYFYERRSDDLHGYEAPAPTPSRLNITYFVSNGYLVFVPDIIYTEGYPGRSAEEYVDAGIDYLKEFDWVNGDKVGIQGQSWGGYQVAHLITRSDRYAAAWAGAPVVNMTSAYGGIRWSTGMNRQFQYEKTQSRIGKNLWDGLDLYMENSPLFHLENVTTPVAIMHNDEDGAVPWYQGIEMFTALRRLQKPVWLLNYNGDEHNLMKRQNRKDIQRREQQFFDHYLKDKPAPVWMTEGIPAVKKGKTWGFELTEEKP